jgi:hypothetical protein
MSKDKWLCDKSTAEFSVGPDYVRKGEQFWQAYNAYQLAFKLNELEEENERLREIEANVDKVTADWSRRCQDIEDENERLRKKVAVGHTVERSIYEDAESWRKLERLAKTMETCQMAIVFVENMSDEK